MTDFSKIFADEFKKRVPDLKVTEAEYDPRHDTVDVVFKSDFPESKRALYDNAKAMSKNHEYGTLGKLGCSIGDVGLFKDGERAHSIEDVADDKDAFIIIHFILPSYVKLLTNAYVSLQSGK